jgi:hypothetical protein
LYLFYMSEPKKNDADGTSCLWLLFSCVFSLEQAQSSILSQFHGVVFCTPPSTTTSRRKRLHSLQQCQYSVLSRRIHCYQLFIKDIMSSRTGGRQSMSELKLRRLIEHNQRLRDDLARPRMRVSEASARYTAFPRLLALSYLTCFCSLIRYCKTTKDHLVRIMASEHQIWPRRISNLFYFHTGSFSLGTSGSSRRSIWTANNGEMLQYSMKFSNVTFFVAVHPDDRLIFLSRRMLLPIGVDFLQNRPFSGTHL